MSGATAILMRADVLEQEGSYEISATNNYTDFGKPCVVRKFAAPSLGTETLCCLLSSCFLLVSSPSRSVALLASSFVLPLLLLASSWLMSRS